MSSRAGVWEGVKTVLVNGWLYTCPLFVLTLLMPGLDGKSFTLRMWVTLTGIGAVSYVARQFFFRDSK